MKIKFMMILICLSFVIPFNSQTVKDENHDSAANLLASYYEAINSKDYRRAYRFWETPQESLENFTQGFKDTEKVQLIIEPSTRTEAAAGSLYASIPTVLVATRTGGRKQTFAGCYTMRKSNLRPPDIPKNDVWHIYRANLNTVSSEADIPQLLSDACAGNSHQNGNFESARVPGVIGFETEQLNDAVKIPETIFVNKEFQITITTSGNGCVSAGDTGVILTESSADVFVYDLTTATRPGIACTMILKQFPHTANLRFSKTGEAVIRVWGRKQGGNMPFGEPVVVEKRVLVR